MSVNVKVTGGLRNIENILEPASISFIVYSKAVSGISSLRLTPGRGNVTPSKRDTLTSA